MWRHSIFFPTHYLDSLSYSIDKTAYPHKRHKAGFCPNYQKKKTEKGSNGFSYNGLILELELQKFSKYHLSLHVGDFY